jgi:uncharacterized protein (TIGR00730 family)
MKSICVYCGSGSGKSEAYILAARELGKNLASRDITLVYGGAKIGIMGAVADSVLENSGRVIGVIPKALVEKEVAHPSLTELHVTGSMHERKMKMSDLSEGFIALPGGIGTLEEISEIWTWAQLGFHKKPFGLLNIEGYFDHLIAFVDHAVNEQFVRPQYRNMLMVEKTIPVLLERIDTYTAPDVEKWIDRSET